MTSVAMAGLKLAVLLLLVGIAAGDLTVDETIVNGCTHNVTARCKTLKTVEEPLTLIPGQSNKYTVTTSIDDTSFTCNFSSIVVANKPVEPFNRTVEIFNLLYNGFTDFPWFSCSSGCTWKTQDDGIYWAQPDGTFKLFSLWTDIN